MQPRFNNRSDVSLCWPSMIYLAFLLLDPLLKALKGLDNLLQMLETWLKYLTTVKGCYFLVIFIYSIRILIASDRSIAKYISKYIMIKVSPIGIFTANLDGL